MKTKRDLKIEVTNTDTKTTTATLSYINTDSTVTQAMTVANKLAAMTQGALTKAQVITTEEIFGGE